MSTESFLIVQEHRGLITPCTQAIFMNEHPQYQTKVKDSRDDRHLAARHLDILNEACMERGASYKGKKEAVVRYLHMYHKVPIVIDPIFGIVTFPTVSPKRFDCMWIFPLNVLDYEPRDSNEVLVTFKDHSTLIVPVSYKVFKNQMERAAMCLQHFAYRPGGNKHSG
ncbi:competence protein ComK [Pontibacillus salicampi]|uniref:Competence protein ComK n=1 Tax=Pontibacillus salicampi TaxID=1449801 RepID=A0ABV6LSF0_9BACI